MALPAEGARLNLSGYLGTVKFTGEVYNTNGTWLGIEWDDPHRGKHDGCKDGKRYFTCRVSNAGSFIRPSTSICYGTTFLQALSSKYIEQLHHSGSQEQIVLGSSNGAIQVEAVNLDKIRRKFSNLFNLREVSVDSENVAICDPEGEIRKTCPNVRGLDISSSLLPSWDVVAMITAELPLLERLALNRNRLQPMRDFAKALSAFVQLTDLQLNDTLTTWQEMQEVTARMPNLRLVEMGYNRLTTLSPFGPISSTIQVINLDTNECCDWSNICQALKPYVALQRLILTSNGIAAITPCLDCRSQLKGLKHISLSFNQLNSWADMDALSRWCPALETLALRGNPLVEDHKLSKYSRQFAIAHIKSLVTLDAAGISHKERVDCERFYLSYIVQHGPKGEQERSREHPRWPELCSKHGRPDEVSDGKERHDKLGNRIIRINMHNYPGSSSDSDSLVFRVLPTMTLRTFRLKVYKAVKTSTRSSQRSVNLWLKMADGTLSQLGKDQDEQDLAWWGFENNSEVFFNIGQE